MFLLLTHAPAIRAEIIDRVAVSVERRVITEAELLRQIRLTALLNNEKPDFSRDSKRRTADRLVEQALIRREIETTKYFAGEDPTDEPYQTFRKSRYPDDAVYKAALAAAQVTDEDVRAWFQWQQQLLSFIDIRFRPGVQIPESDVQDYYRDQFVPDAHAKGIKPPSYDDARSAVENILLAQRVDNALDRWLGQVRTQTRIRYRDPVFQ